MQDQEMNGAHVYTFLRQIITQADFPEPQCWHRHSFASNDVIIHEGDEDHYIYLVEKGSLMVTSNIELDESVVQDVRPIPWQEI